MSSFLHFRYVYSFYSDGELMIEDVIDEKFEITLGCRFTIHDQEDGSFILSEVHTDSCGKFVIVTFPGKDVIVVREGESTELVYDEYYSAMGDDNHNVYVGTLTLVKD